MSGVLYLAQPEHAAAEREGMSLQPYAVYLRKLRALYLYSNGRKTGTAKVEFSLSFDRDCETLFENGRLYEKKSLWDL